jgi:hypothetical protein
MSKRKIVVNNIIYEWCYGGQGAVIWDAERKQHHADICDLTGFKSPDTFERGQWRKTIDGMIVPSQIERWIRIHMLKEDIEPWSR